MFTYKVGIPAQEHDDFISNHPQANVLQSSSWAAVKDEWGNERLGFYQNQKLVAVASVLIQPLPLGLTMLYIPRGPIMDYTNKDLVAFVLKSLKEFGRKQKALFVKFDPLLVLRVQQAGQFDEDHKDSLTAIDNLRTLGTEWVGRTLSLDETIQPRFQANIHKDDFTEEQLSKSTKQAIRTARNKGVEVIFGGPELLDDFSQLMKKTEGRKQIALRGRDYYAKLLNNFPGHSYITMAKIDLAKRQEELSQQLAKLSKQAEAFTEKTKPGKVKQNQDDQNRIQEELDFIQQALADGHNMVPLAGTLTVQFADTSENLYAGMDEYFRRYQPAILTWYETALHSLENGGRWQNMGGVENQLDGGLYNFKTKFNPQIEELVGEFNLPVSPLYKLANFAYTLRKKLRSKH